MHKKSPNVFHKGDLKVHVKPNAILRACSHRKTHVTLTGGTFGLSDGHCDWQNLLHIHFALQHNGIPKGVAWCEQVFTRVILTLRRSLERYNAGMSNDIMSVFCATKFPPITAALSRPNYHKRAKAHLPNLTGTPTQSLSWNKPETTFSAYSPEGISQTISLLLTS